MRRFDAVLFDLFGTLIDILPQSVYDEAGRKVSAALGVPADEFIRVWKECGPNRNSGQFGSVEGDIRHACGMLGVSPTPEGVAEAAAIRIALQRRNQVPRPGTVETLLQLRSAGYKLALVSDAFVDVTRVWPKGKLAPLMDAAVFSCDLGITKPDPVMCNTACEGIGVEPGRCLYVGDGGSNELAGAKALGMTPVLIRVDYDHEFDVRRPSIMDWKGPTITGIAQVLGLLEPY